MLALTRCCILQNFSIRHTKLSASDTHPSRSRFFFSDLPCFVSISLHALPAHAIGWLPTAFRGPASSALARQHRVFAASAARTLALSKTISNEKEWQISNGSPLGAESHGQPHLRGDCRWNSGGPGRQKRGARSGSRRGALARRRRSRSGGVSHRTAAAPPPPAATELPRRSALRCSSLARSWP